MTIDPIVDELHRERAEEMERLDYDYETFFRRLKEEERRSGKPVVSPPESPPNLAVQRTRATRR